MILISKIFGWLSFIVWSISFYPQVYTNYKHKTSEGVTLDMNIYYILGYVFYSTYLFTMYFNSPISMKYEELLNITTTEIDISDIFFVSHSFILSIVLTAQYFYYKQQFTKPLDCLNKIIIISISTGMALYLILTLCLPENIAKWVYFIFTCGMINNIITCIKYLPQVIYHYKNKSTGKWNIWNTHTDIAGAIFLIAQICSDAFASSDLSIIYSNLTKLNLTLITIVFDTIIYTQYCKYKKKGRKFISNPYSNISSELQTSLV